VERVLFAPRELPPLGADVAENPGPYSQWVQQYARERQRSSGQIPSRRNLKLLMVVPDEPPPETVRTLQALDGQSSPNWTLHVILREEWQASFTSLIAVSGLRRSSTRVRLEYADAAAGVDEMCNQALAASEGEDIAFLAPGDLWAFDAVALLAGALTPDAMVYADEDQVSADGDHFAPRLKPDFSPEFLLSCSYIGRPLALGAHVVSSLPPLRAPAMAEFEHDLALLASEAARRVLHIPLVLCHRLVGSPVASPPNADPAAPVRAALARRSELAEVSAGPAPGTFRVHRRLADQPMVSIVIPFRDEPRMLRACIDSIDATKGAAPLQLVLMDNGSEEPETQSLMDMLAARNDVTIRHDPGPFNWARLNNEAARIASGDVLLFLNNDIEALGGGWIETLSAQALRPSIGAVGARLLYPGGRVQHCGVVIGLGGAAGHPFVGLDGAEPGYLSMATVSRECAAVTGACLATRRDVFDHLGGFDEALGVDLNDIDYCLRAQRGGWRIVFEAGVELVHHESPSRGTAGDVRDIVHFIDRWESSIRAGDPYLNPALTRLDSSCGLRQPHEAQWWDQWRRSLSSSND
jgi:GT2 family glycosyltransferase